MINAEIGHRIKVLRVALGLNQKDLAAKIGLSRPSITNIESGRQDLSTASLTILAETLGVTAGALLGLEPMPAAPPIVKISATWTVICEECGPIVSHNSRGIAEMKRTGHLAEHVKQSGEASRTS